MTITYLCPSCNSPNRVPDVSAGKNVRCHLCNTVFKPSASEASKSSNGGTILLIVGAAGFLLLGLCVASGMAALWFWPAKMPPGPGPVAVTPPTKVPLVEEKKKLPIIEEKKLPIVEEKKPPILEKKQPIIIDDLPPIEEKKTDPPIAPKKKDRVLSQITHKLEPGKRYPREMEAFSTVLDDVSVRKIVPSIYTHTPYWYPEGKSFVTIQYHCNLMEIDANDFAIHRERVLYEGAKPMFLRGGVSHALDGLLALRSLDHEAKGEDIQLLVIDPITLMPNKKIPCPNASLVASSHLISVAFVGGKNTYDGKQADLMIVDLKTGETSKVELEFPLNPQTFQVTRDGKYFFGTDGKSIVRYRIDGTNLIHEETGPIVFDKVNTEPRLGLSSDGERIWLFGVDPAKQQVPANTQFRVCKAKQLKAAYQMLGFPVTAMAFDPRDKLNLAADSLPGVWFLATGFPERYAFSIRPTSQIVMNPQGGSALLQCGPDLYHAHWRK
jgi:hypothetical protein